MGETERVVNQCVLERDDTLELIMISTTERVEGVVAQMEAGTLLASDWSWSLQLGAKASGP